MFQITKDSCTLLTESHFCDFESVINGTPVQIICWCFLVITIERAIASLYYKRYERLRCTEVAVLVGLIPVSFISVTSWRNALQRNSRYTGKLRPLLIPHLSVDLPTHPLRHGRRICLVETLDSRPLL